VISYDELRGPDLDEAHWRPARLPLPTGAEHTPLDANTEVAVGGGEVRVTIPRFSLAHDTFQIADSPKYLVFSTREFELAPHRKARFAVDLAVENIGGDPGDYRQGMAAFHAFDLGVTRRVFAVCGTSTRVLALHEQLGATWTTTTSPGSARARSRSTATPRQQPGESTITPCTRSTAR